MPLPLFKAHCTIDGADAQNAMCVAADDGTFGLKALVRLSLRVIFFFFFACLRELTMTGCRAYCDLLSLPLELVIGLSLPEDVIVVQMAFPA